MDYMKKYNEWLESDYFDSQFIEELKAIKDDPKEIEDRFYTDLAFGTGGMRGIIGAGTNRINRYIIRKATQGFANYIKLANEGELSVVIAHDSRNMSKEFALESALVLAGNGIKAYLFEDLRTTPELSFSVRELGASGGIVITASHNPPEYNGYKVYGDDGCQLTPEKADMLVEEVEKIADFDQILIHSEEDAKDSGMLAYLGEAMDAKYIDMVKGLLKRKDLIAEKGNDTKIVYTPLHGTGGMPIVRTLKELGYDQLITVDEQMIPDGNFPTVSYPNPEDIKAFDLAIQYAEKNNAEVIIATDPDSDRVGVVIKDEEGKYVGINGNQMGALLLDYILSSYDKTPENGVVISTIVTSGIGAALAKKYNVESEETLTGFKFIGEKIRKYEDGSKQFLFGYEESYGYLTGTAVRDKDAVIATTHIVEMIIYYKQQGKSLLDKLEDIYKDVGYYTEDLLSFTMKGKEGMEKIVQIMSDMRDNCPKEVSGFKVARVEDYLCPEKTGLPKSNVLKFYFEDGSWFAMRPSGTEPKLKVYISAVDASRELSKKKVESIKAEVTKFVQ